jgi:hypothetical protein
VAAAAAVSANDPVLAAWQAQNAGGPSPELVRQDDGGTKIVWTGNVSADIYSNHVSSPSGTVTSALRNGGYSKTVVQSDLRGTGGAGQTTYFQLGWTASDDPAVLSQHQRQINNVQIGRAGEGYQVAIGDVMANYSTLGSGIGARGASGQAQLGKWSLSGYGGVVAPSWEALAGLVPRTQCLRDVQGGKVEYALLPGAKVYATAQSAGDREASVPAGSSYSQPMAIRSHSVGFQYQDGNLQATGEYAHGGSGIKNQNWHQGDALVLDANWRTEKWNFRGGVHDLDPGFASLAGSVQPGIWEAYANADWTASSWLTLSGEARNTRNRAEANSYSPATTTVTHSNSLRANANFGPNLPGWGSTFQQTRSQTRSPQNTISRTVQSNGQLNFSSPKVNASLGYGLGTAANDASPDYNSQTTSWQLNYARNYSDGTPTTAQTWNLSLNFNGNLQKQEMANGSVTDNLNYSIGLNGQHDGWGSLQLAYTGGVMTQPYGAPDMRQIGLTLDATRPLPHNASVKVYVRDNQRNIGAPLMQAHEAVSGLQFNAPF